MGVPSGRLQFFALEASDYLERLAIIIGRPGAPDPEELVRLTRALRGAALMAGLQPYAQAAAALEQVAKSHREQPTSWGPADVETVASAVEEFQRLTRSAAAWSDQDSAAASALARRLAAGLEQPAADRTARAPQSDDVQPSVRTFIGREGALIAGTLEHAAQSLELGQPADAAEVVLNRLQPLRGLATLPSLSPLPEFLDAIELTVRSLRDEAAPPDGPDALRRAAAAVTRLARDIAERGKAGADTPEVVLGAVSLLESFGRDDDVVDISTLFRTGDPNPIVSGGRVAAGDEAPDVMIELVSLADRLRQAAEQVGSPASATGRTLYLYGLLVQLRPLTLAAPRERPHLSGLLQGIATAIGRGGASREPVGFAAVLRDAAGQLGRAAEARNAVFLGEDLAPMVAALADLAGPAPVRSSVEPVVERPAAVAPEDRAAVPPAVADETDVVPIESLAPDPEPAPVPIETLAPALSSFEQSFATYHRLQSRPAAPPAPAAATKLPPVTGLPAPEPVDADVVSIDSLLLRGRRALERADQVRLELSEGLKSHRPFQEIEPLVSELIDLVPLALEE